MKYTESVYQGMNMITRYPNGYDQGIENGKKYPLIVLLHGAGSRGTDVSVLRENRFFAITDKYEDFPFISTALQCSANTWFDVFETLQRFIKDCVAMPGVDPERVYLVGASMGGYATWQLAMTMPEYFAAIVPICGGGMYWNAARLRNVAIWAFHGAKDPTVLCEESQKMVDAAVRCGADARLTVYPENGHDAWSDTYSNPEVFEWLKEHKNSNAAELIDKYHGSDIYG